MSYFVYPKGDLKKCKLCEGNGTIYIWRSDLEEVYMFSSPKKNKETPKKKETWYERDERKAKEKKLRKESTEVQEGNNRLSRTPRGMQTSACFLSGCPWFQKYRSPPRHHPL